MSDLLLHISGDLVSPSRKHNEPRRVKISQVK